MLHGNAWDRKTWGRRDWQHCFVLAMEVLDNLPHDRVTRNDEQSEWRQTVVHSIEGCAMEDGPWIETVEKVDDPLVERCLAATYQ